MINVNQARIDAVCAQRNRAQDEVAELQAQLTMANAQIASMRGEVEELRKKLSAASPPEPEAPQQKDPAQ